MTPVAPLTIVALAVAICFAILHFVAWVFVFLVLAALNEATILYLAASAPDER